VDAPITPVAATLPAYATPTLPPGSVGENVMVGAVMVMVSGDEVTLNGVGVPESVALNVRLV
jgi:hypothetical protein